MAAQLGWQSSGYKNLRFMFCKVRTDIELCWLQKLAPAASFPQHVEQAQMLTPPAFLSNNSHVCTDRIMCEA